MEILKPAVIVQIFLGLLLKEIKGESIACCENLAHIPFDDGTMGKFLASVNCDAIRDQDLCISQPEFTALHLEKMAHDLADTLKGYIQACPGCELLVFNLELPGGMEWSERATSANHLSVRLVRGYSIKENLKHTRFDVLFGIRAKKPVAAEAAA